MGREHFIRFLRLQNKKNIQLTKHHWRVFSKQQERLLKFGCWDIQCSTLCLRPRALSSPSKVAGSAAFKGRLLLFSKLTQFTEIQHTRSNGALIAEHHQIHVKFVLRPPFLIFFYCFSLTHPHINHTQTHPFKQWKTSFKALKPRFPRSSCGLM